MVCKTLKSVWHKLCSKRVHRIDEDTAYPNTSHWTSDTFCGNIPATSTTIAGEARIQVPPSDSEYSFAVSPNDSSTFREQQIEFNNQAREAFEQTFKRYFGNSYLFVKGDMLNVVDAYNSWIHLKHVRDTLEKMMEFYAIQNHRMDGSELLMDTYFRCFYDFITSAIRQLESVFPTLHKHHLRRQTNRFRTTRHYRNSGSSSSSGYNSSTTSMYSNSSNGYYSRHQVQRRSCYFTPIPESYIS